MQTSTSLRSAGRADPLGVSRRTALLLVPVLITVHNAEEALLIPSVLRVLPRRLPSGLGLSIPTYPQFLAALAVVTLVPWLVWLFGVARRETRAGVTLLLLVQMVMLVNVASHVGAAVFLGGYAPGVVTALALNLPFSIHLFRRAMAERWISLRTLAFLFTAAVLIHGPGLFGLMWIAGRAIGGS